MSSKILCVFEEDFDEIVSHIKERDRRRIKRGIYRRGLVLEEETGNVHTRARTRVCTKNRGDKNVHARVCTKNRNVHARLLTTFVRTIQLHIGKQETSQCVKQGLDCGHAEAVKGEDSGAPSERIEHLRGAHGCAPPTDAQVGKNTFLNQESYSCLNRKENTSAEDKLNQALLNIPTNPARAIRIWFRSGFRTGIRPGTKAFDESVHMLKLLFNSSLSKKFPDPSLTKYKYRKFTVRDFEEAVSNYARKWKNPLNGNGRPLSLSRFIYNPFYKRGRRSPFVFYLENKPRTPGKVAADRVKETEESKVVKGRLIRFYEKYVKGTKTDKEERAVLKRASVKVAKVVGEFEERRNLEVTDIGGCVWDAMVDMGEVGWIKTPGFFLSENFEKHLVKFMGGHREYYFWGKGEREREMREWNEKQREMEERRWRRAMEDMTEEELMELQN